MNEEEDLKGASVTIKPEIEEYPYGDVYTLYFIINKKPYYKFSGVTPEETIEKCLYHLKCLLTEEIFEQ